MKETKTNKKHVGQYTLTHIKRQKKQIFLLSVPTVLILTLFIVAFTSYQEMSVASFQNFFSGIDNRTIVFSTQQLKRSEIEQLNEQQILVHHDGKRIGFTEEDLLTVQAIPFVERADLTRSSVKSTFDYENYLLEKYLSEEELTAYLEATSIESNRGIQLSFEAMIVPQQLISHYNLDNIQLIAGQFPQDKSREIVIPDFFAKSLVKDEAIEGLIGEEITLSAKQINGEETKAEESRNYTVVGIYKSNLKRNRGNEYPIYVSYFENPIILSGEQLEESYQFFYDSYNVNPQTFNYSKEIVKDKEAYAKSLGTGFDRMIVVVESDKKLKSVIKEIENFFPKYQLVSQEDIKTGDLSEIYRDLVLILVLGSLVIALIIGVIIVFMNKGYIYNRSYELAVLYSQGFSKGQLVRSIVFENILLYSLYLVIAFLIAWLIKVFIFSQFHFYWLLDQLLTVKNIGSIVLLMLVISSLSILWGINHINHKHLLRQLNEQK